MKNRIRQLRKEHHMSQVRLSTELNVSQETISAYENQKYFPIFSQLLKMSELFHASIDYIMGLSDVRCPTNLTDNDNIQKLLNLAKRLNKDQLERAIIYVQGMLDA